MDSILFKKIRPEVENCAYNILDFDELTNKEIDEITELIVNRDPRIRHLLYMDPYEVSDYSDDDDWSEINGQIEDVIRWYMQNPLVRIFSLPKV